MSEQSQGWISVYRQIEDSWIWQDKPFDRAHAWIDLLMEVNHKDGKKLINGILYDVKRGEKITSIKKICRRWGWSNTKVKMFLDALRDDGMIVYKSDAKKTTINIVNYSLYQGTAISENVAETSQKRRRNVTETSLKHTNNNDNNVNNVNNVKEKERDKEKEKRLPAKNKYAEFVSMTEGEYQKLIDSYGEANVKLMIEKLDNYKGANGKRYKNDYRAILNWVAKEIMKGGCADGRDGADRGNTTKPNYKIKIPERQVHHYTDEEIQQLGII